MNIEVERSSLVNETYQLAFDGLDESLNLDEASVRSSNTPPHEVLLKDPRQRIETPTDSRGLVDLPTLIEEVCSYVDPEYQWRGEEDRHHLYWFEKLYSTPSLFSQDEKLARTFRSLPLHIVELPRELHDFLHIVSTPVEVPDPEVMEYRIDSWNVAVNLFNHVSFIHSHRFISNTDAADRVNRKKLKNRFRRFEDDYETALRLPQEFRIFEVSALERILGASKVDHIRQRDLQRAKKDLNPVFRTNKRKRISIADSKRIGNVTDSSRTPVEELAA